ncbi:LacI family DNA-binding transcriptional regulator [Rhodococcus sp. SORGH_AS_0303]|uniref:LacI family DNA-binding transcriptional regulator n=1 Tax=Rhodococcus sp. SORGH_AS_0303 TaxID=3041753 RepID=UPI0027D7A92A|nr:LacI family DNA-binding transcriptional regulator [Rhodococcus sp. SORGH_AS_0303]
MTDVARAAGVSTALVSIVFRDSPGASDATRARVREIADELGYVRDRRASSLRQSHSRLLGVVFELQQPFHGDLVEHVYSAAARRGYEVALSAVAPSRGETAAIDSLRHDRCEATILLGSRLPEDELAALARTVPTVVVARRVDTPDTVTVRSDDVAGITLAVRHLEELGHRRIAFVDGDGAPGSEDRSAGFLDALSHIDDSRAEVVRGGLTEDDGARAVEGLLDTEHPPTAVIAFNDRCATGVLAALVARGLAVPRDMSVIGYDDSRVAGLDHVALTTVSQDAESLADAAVDAALTLTVDDSAPSIVLTPSLVSRSTTGAPRATS